MGDDEIPLRIHEEIEKVLDMEAVRATWRETERQKEETLDAIRDHGLLGDDDEPDDDDEGDST